LPAREGGIEFQGLNGKGKRSGKARDDRKSKKKAGEKGGELLLFKKTRGERSIKPFLWAEVGFCQGQKKLGKREQKIRLLSLGEKSRRLRERKKKK